MGDTYLDSPKNIIQPDFNDRFKSPANRYEFLSSREKLNYANQLNLVFDSDQDFPISVHNLSPSGVLFATFLIVDTIQILTGSSCLIGLRMMDQDFLTLVSDATKEKVGGKLYADTFGEYKKRKKENQNYSPKLMGVIELAQEVNGSYILEAAVSSIPCLVTTRRTEDGNIINLNNITTIISSEPELDSQHPLCQMRENIIEASLLLVRKLFLPYASSKTEP